MAALARGGRLNAFGFILRLAARLPFLFIAGRIYGAEALGRFAYAVLTVEFAAQLSALGLRRGLAQLLANSEKDHACVVADSLLVAALGSVVCMVVLGLFPQAMFPNSPVYGLDWLLPVTVLAISWTDIALAALAYRNDVGATVRARSIVEPWTISIVAFIWAYVSTRDGLIIAYVFSMVAALIAALIPLVKSYGLPRGWKPDLAGAWATARRNSPLAAADAVEWASRRVDLAVLGLFMSPAFVGIYYVAQQVATLPAKLKTSFEPVLGPVIARNIAEGDLKAVAKQVRQVSYWIIAAQAGIALSLAIPGRAVMGLVGSGFTGGTATLGFLLAAEVIAATAVVSEAALIYVERHRNMLISLVMLALEAALGAGLIILMRKLGRPEPYQATGPAIGLCLALAFASVAKSRLLYRVLGDRVSGWRWDIIWATAAGLAVGIPLRLFLNEWLQLFIAIPLILAAFGAVLWTKGFGPEDRELFRMRKRDIEELQENQAKAQIADDVI
ncbi:lipopolysaccharide biosynthesis protein [Sphingomonas ginkgonis]|uniref:Lipopolysaccharide biosynthesis protein n=1 Tax=Sphingomonas ginkgonis TaxID=2315330 RepID=A0A3R9Z857_9SPHN|nr:lipopolysaccharide biosynthesis protein [Sphingomonas ginkgonis]RST32077.1 lipopolysaccharide biosynthesis protein [Sphingomonas ginkgonis]